MVLNNRFIKLVLLWLIVHCTVSGVNSHSTPAIFRGAIFMVRPAPNGAAREVSSVKNVCKIASIYM